MDNRNPIDCHRRGDPFLFLTKENKNSTPKSPTANAQIQSDRTIVLQPIRIRQSMCGTSTRLKWLFLNKKTSLNAGKYSTTIPLSQKVYDTYYFFTFTLNMI